MSTDRKAVAGNVAQLVQNYRQRAGVSQTRLAALADVSRSRLNTVESASVLPSLDACLRVAQVLGIPVEEMSIAYLKDAVHEVAPEYETQLESALGGAAFWSDIADQHGLRIEHGRTTATVASSGDLRLVRQWSGCYATRPLNMLVFQDQIVGMKPPTFAITDSPVSNYEHRVRTEGDWRIHQIKFEKPWTPVDDPFDFELVTTLTGAYDLDLPGGRFRSYIDHPFEHLEIAIELPEDLAPNWLEPIVHWGTRSLDETSSHVITGKACQSVRFEGGTHSARLVLGRPMPGFTFGMPWSKEETSTGPEKSDGRGEER